MIQNANSFIPDSEQQPSQSPTPDVLLPKPEVSQETQQERPEQVPEQKQTKPQVTEQPVYTPPPQPAVAPALPPPTPRDELILEIEKIMQEDLEAAFNAMTPTQQQEFKIKGEKTAYEIKELMKKSRVKMKKVFKLIVEWLNFLPGINKFFLEQEAKIKADKILSLKHRTSL